jgi:hypothetical protein
LHPADNEVADFSVDLFQELFRYPLKRMGGTMGASSFKSELAAVFLVNVFQDFLFLKAREDGGFGNYPHG